MDLNDLTPEQRHQIYQEETARLKAEAEAAELERREAERAAQAIPASAAPPPEGQTVPPSAPVSGDRWQQTASPAATLAAFGVLFVFTVGLYQCVATPRGQDAKPATVAATPAPTPAATPTPLTAKSLLTLGTTKRAAKDFAGSNAALKQLVAKFPKSQQAKQAKVFLAKNATDYPSHLYAQALAARRQNQFGDSTVTAKKLMGAFPQSAFVGRARALIRQNEESERVEAERQARAGSDLEILSLRGTITASGSYIEIDGLVRNLSREPLERVEAVASHFDSAGNFVRADSALIDYNPIMPGQDSPFKVMGTYNPAMKTFRVEFKHLMGGTIATYDGRRH